MSIVSLLLRMIGGLSMFLFGMKIMSDGIQQSAGDQLRKTLNFMTGNRFVGVLTGFIVTGIIQSSSAVTVMVVSFVNAGLLTLTQSIGVIMGANIGTTVTAWIVSLVGFSLKISELALPAVGIGFVLSVIKWKHKSLGELIMGFGLLFLGLHYLTQEMNGINRIINFNAISAFRDMGFGAILIGAGAGLLMTLLTHSSSAATAIVLTMAFSDIITFEMAAGMVLGSNVGTTIDAALAAIGARTPAKQAALVHVMFNVLGTLWALPLIKPLLVLVNFLAPGNPVPGDPSITIHLAMLHSVFNMINTIIFLPFVNSFAKLVSIIIREVKQEESEHYQFTYYSSAISDSPDLGILRAEKEVRDMACIVSAMYARFSAELQSLRKGGGKDQENTAALCTELLNKENYVDEMREVLSDFLVECSHKPLNVNSETRVSYLMRVVVNLEEMSDECYSISRLLEKSVRRDCRFDDMEMDDLIPYVGLVEEFLVLLDEQLDRNLTAEQTARAMELEANIDKTRKKLQKLGRKRIEAGKNVRTELLFLDIVRRIEKLGDYCFSITETPTG
ncbi:MAG: Na/Pi cotransporter family protein [Treponema sp.]|nr:Na/Pi cotransporter family protein [Treponema sp.]